MKYPVVIHKDDSSDFSVTVPDLSGCFSAGASIDEALQNSQEAIECHIEGLMIDGEEYSLPSAIESHQTNELYAGGIWAVVSVDISKLSGRAKRINITLPERLLTRIDSFAAEHHETRSGFLASAALEYMSRENQPPSA